MTYLKHIYSFLLVLSLASAVSAQQDKDEVKAFLLKAQKAYHESSYLGFRVRYLYMNAGKDSRPMDSLSGEIQMDKERCRMMIDGMETVVTGKYVIQIMEEDKSIYLSRSAKPGLMDPVQLMDTVYKQLDGIHATIFSEGSWKALTLKFPPGRMYTQITMVMDSATGYFQRITYDVHTVGLVGQEQVDRPGHPAPYSQEGKIDMIFSNYEKGRFSDALFDEKNFFTREAGRFQPAGRYRDYHIFLASSNL